MEIDMEEMISYISKVVGISEELVTLVLEAQQEHEHDLLYGDDND